MNERISMVGTIKLPPGIGVSIYFGRLPEILPGNPSVLERVDWVDPVVITFTRDGAFLMNFAINGRDLDSLDQTVSEFLEMALAASEASDPDTSPGPRLVS